MTSRRRFIALVGGTILVWPPELRGQEPGRVYRLGGLHMSPRDAPHHLAMFDELRRLGFVEGQNLTIDPRGYGLRTEQLAQHATELADARVDAILAGGNASIRAAQQATATIPILGLTEDMLGEGLVHSLAHPGGNTTGVSLLATELDGKRQELLIELIPGARHIAALADSLTAAPDKLRALREMARTRNIELDIREVSTPEEIAPAIDAAKASGAAGLNVLAAALLFNNRRIIFERTAALGLPATYQWPELAQEGGLAGYGPSIVRIYRLQLSRMLAQLFRGAKPHNVPVEQPTTFELVINLKTAQTLGLTVPPSILGRTDEVIE